MLESAQKSAKRLSEQNKDQPEVCSKINARLATVSSPFTKSLETLKDKQGKLDRVQKAAEKYEEEKRPLVEYLEEAHSAVEELQPFGINVEDGDKQIEDLKVSLNLKDVKFSLSMSVFVMVFTIARPVYFQCPYQSASEGSLAILQCLSNT